MIEGLPKILLVEWEDAGAAPGWHTMRQAIEYHEKRLLHFSVGFLLREDKDAITLNTSVAKGSDDVGELLHIPMGMVRTIRDLS